MNKFLLLIIFSFAISSWASGNELPADNPALESRFISKLNRPVTFMGLGTVELGRDWGIGLHNRKLPSENTAREILTTMAYLPLSVIDTAASYQLSEERIGRYAQPSRRPTLLIITKVGEHSLLSNDPQCAKSLSNKIYCEQPKAAYDFSPDAIYREVEQSLKKLNVDSLDVVLLHLNDETADEVLNKGEAVAALKQLQKENKIGFIGVSINGSVAKRCIESNDFDIIELEYSLLNQTNAENLELAHAKGMGVIVRGGLGTGLLTSQVKPYLNDKKLPYYKQVNALSELVAGDYDTLTQLALAFLYKNKNISSVIVGVSSPQQLLKNVELLKRFSNHDLLTQAEKLMATFKTPTEYTADMGEYEDEEPDNTN